MIFDPSVRTLLSTYTGAPQLNGVAGSLIGVLDAGLQNGCNEVTLDNLVITDGVAVATRGAAHSFVALGIVGPVIRIANATPSVLNDDWRTQIISPTQFSFPIAGVGNQTATGTITAKYAPAGWQKVFAGTNKAVYRHIVADGTKKFLRVDDSFGTYAIISSYESMSDIDNGTFLWPSSTRYINKSTTSNTVSRPYRLFADSRLFYFFVFAHSDAFADGYVFGDPIAYSTNDAYCCWLLANESNQSYGYSLIANRGGNVAGSDFCQSYNPNSVSVTAGKYSHGRLTGLMSNNNPVDNSIFYSAVELWENGSSSVAYPRAIVPGFFCVLHTGYPADGFIDAAIINKPNSVLFVQAIDASNRVAIEINQSWR